VDEQVSADEGVRSSPGRATVWGGAVAGVLDLAAAMTLYGLRGAQPARILQSIASGLLGPAAYRGGMATAALGCALHFLIALVAAALHVGASRRLAVLIRRPILSGLLYGVVVYFVMNWIVVPLSVIPGGPFRPGLAATLVLVHMLFVGLPIALATARFLGRKS
jgi:hypothetical protein